MNCCQDPQSKENGGFYPSVIAGGFCSTGQVGQKSRGIHTRKVQTGLIEKICYW